MSKVLLVMVISSMLLVCSRSAPPPADPAFVAEWQKWHQARIDRLKSEEGWLSLVGLHWLQPGENRFDGVPGVYTLTEGKVLLTTGPDEGVTLDNQPLATRELAPDVSGKPDQLAKGSLRWYVIVRGDKVGLRVKDIESPVRQSFTGIDTYPVHQDWRIEARWEPYTEPREVPIPNVLGQVDKGVARGRVHFTVDGKEYMLEPTQAKPDSDLEFMFKDGTSGHGSYPAGRFLYSGPPQDGKVWIDFNRAYNPPCAFTPYATCPLPNEQNKITALIEAGEKHWGSH
jgi:hypothetical protein